MKISRKELDKNIKRVLKNIVKGYGYKTRGNVLYKKYKDYFISILISSTGQNNNLINIRGNIKPYFMDDIFWDIFKMEDNIKAPMGLRADGAFTVRSLQIFNENREVADYQEVENYVKELLLECDKYIIKIIEELGEDLWKFIAYSHEQANPGLFKYALAKMLLDIREKNYQEAYNTAVEELNNHRYGGLQNEGKDIYEHIKYYCENKIN